MKISDILRHKAELAAGGAGSAISVVTVAPGDTVHVLVTALAEHNVGAAVVTDAGAVVGVASERDVVRHLAGDDAGALDAPVSSIMTSDVRTCGPDDAVDDIAAAMTERRIRHLPVITDGALTGIVSIGDVVSSHIRQLEQDRGQLEQYISG